MARKKLLRIVTLIISMIIFLNASAATKSGAVAHRKSAKEFAVTQNNEPDKKAMEKQAPASPASRTEGALEKHTKPNSEELAHIHHFHKERVKKIKRHHKKFWIVSKVLLLLCHLALLVIAFLHLTH